MADHDTHDHTGVPGVGTAVSDIIDLPTAETDDTKRLAPDGAGGVEWASGGGGVADDLTTAETDTSLRLAPDGAGGVEWAAGGGSSGLTLLEQHTASNSGTLDFTTFISSTYDDYVIECLALRPATNAATLQVQVGTGAGPSWDSGSNYYNARYNQTTAPASGGTGGGPATSMTISGTISNAAGGYGNFNGTHHLKNPESTTVMRYIYGNFAMHDGTNVILGFSGGLYAAAVGTALTGLRFFMSAGNITSGIIRVYGVAK